MDANTEAGAESRPFADARQANRRAGGLRTPGLLGRQPIIGLVLVVLGLTVFGVLAFNVLTDGPVVQDDKVVAQAVYDVAVTSSPVVRYLMIVGYYLGQHVIVVIGVLLAVYFIHRRFWTELAMIGIAWGGEGSLWLLLSGFFDRSRPVFENPIWQHQISAPGFPSGHSISAVMCYGLLAYLYAPVLPSRRWRIVLGVAAVLVILLIGFSRIFVGHHYLSDVLAGLALGVAWSALVYTGVELVARRSRARAAPEATPIRN